jgi:antitoxin PrlF
MMDLKIDVRSRTMPAIYEFATLTSKGQITLPKSIRQALGVSTGAKVAFELREGAVVVTRAEGEHEDPAIGAFLDLLETDIRKGKNIGTLPPKLARAMLANVSRGTPDEDIEGDVAL